MSLLLGERVTRWALGEPSVQLLVLIGSHSRPANDVAGADASSDWDFQIATTAPEMFADSRWTDALQGPPLHYVYRPGRLGSAQKVTALFPDGELDLVVIPAPALRGVAQLVEAGRHGTNPAAVGAIADLAAVLQGGYTIRKGADEFGGLYRFVVAGISAARLSNEAVCQLADGFVCDYVSTVRKIARGEALAAQRWLHVQLAEANFKLLHELRLREGKVSFPDARRLERFADPRLAAVAVEATLDIAALGRAVDKAAATARALVAALVGDAWRWPQGLPTCG
jgi:hypothetical protein